MAIIVKTPGSANSNSYADVSDADTQLLEERVGAADWDLVPDKSAALIMATQQLERLTLKGSRASSTQALHFPATGATYADGRTIPADIVPVGMIRATIELAYWLGQKDRTALPGEHLLEKLKLGPMDLTFRDQPGTGGILSSLPDIVVGHLTGLTVSGVGGGSGVYKVLRG
jgi:hypothetical protein